MSIYFVEHSWLELKKAIERNTLIILPVGQIEEHGPHLPVETDYRIGIEICRQTAEKVSAYLPVLLMPSIWSGYSNREVAHWPGTIRVQPETLIALVFDVCNSLVEMGFKKIVIVNSHGQHKGILEIVTRKIGDKHDIHMAAVHTFLLAADIISKFRKSELGGAGHAGEIETSLMLYLTDLVDMSKADSIDRCKYNSKFKSCDGFAGGSKVYWSTWAIEKSEKGALGDPTKATKETGRKVMDAAVDELTEFLTEYYNFKSNKELKDNKM